MVYHFKLKVLKNDKSRVGSIKDVYRYHDDGDDDDRNDNHDDDHQQ